MKKILLLSLCLISSLTYAQDSLNISLVYHWSDSTIPTPSAYDNPYNEIWGYADETGEYAIIGSTMGTHIFNVTDPDNVTEVDYVQGAATGSGIIHRDYHDYAGYLYMVCQEGPSTLQIADLSYLPDSVHVVYDSNEHIKGSHNIFIDSTSALLYSMDTYPQTGSLIGLRVLSLEDPEAPTFIVDMFPGSDVHDAYIRNDTAYLNRGWNSSLEVWDFSEPTEAVLLGSIDTYEGQGYNHSGWLTDDGNYYVMGDETHGSPVKVLDVSDLSDIEVVATMESGVATNSIPHNQIIQGHHIYSAYYYDGVYVWDISDPEDPILSGYYDTSTEPNGNSYKGNWGIYPFLPSGLLLASDMQNGLFVLETDFALGIDDNERRNIDFNVFPNPAQDKVMISFDNSSGTQARIAIYDLSGKMQLEQFSDLNTNTIDVSNLSPGIYFVELIANGKGVQKIVIQ